MGNGFTTMSLKRNCDRKQNYRRRGLMREWRGDPELIKSELDRRSHFPASSRGGRGQMLPSAPRALIPSSAERGCN